MFGYLTSLGVDGFMISPGYSYAAVDTKEIFMTRDDIRAKFRQADAMFKKYRFNTSPVYLEFLQGKREMSCTAWGNPTRNVKGWKGPCYLITDIHHKSFDDLLNKTPWEKYGYGNDPRCENCMVHAGYEASAALGVNGKLGDTLKMVKWTLKS
jgi:hopanoid biosynthesis associated radical SAM protein HpnH